MHRQATTVDTDHQQRRPSASSFDFYSSTFNSRTLGRLQKLTDRLYALASTTPSTTTRFYVSGTTSPSSSRDVDSECSTNYEVVECRSIEENNTSFFDMDLAKRLRKFMQKRLHNSDDHKDRSIEKNGKEFLDCDCCPYEANGEMQETDRMEKKLRKFLRNIQSEKLSSSSKTQDRKPYAAIMNLLSTQCRGATTQEMQTIEENKSCQINNDHTKITKATPFCPCFLRQESTNIYQEKCREAYFEAQVDVSIKIIACTLSRPNFHESFGLKFSDQKGGARIEYIEEHSPASTANLKPMDKIIAINGQNVKDNDKVKLIWQEMVEAKLIIERVEDKKLENDPDQSKSEIDSCADDPIAIENKKDDKNRSRLATVRCRDPLTDDADLEKWLDRARTYPRGTILDKFPEARAFLRLMGRPTYSEEFRDCNM